MRVASRSGWIALLALGLAGLAGAPARADLIFFQDGYVLQGKVRREMTAELDPVSKEMTLIPKGFILLDDGPRRIYFSQNQVRIVEQLPPPPTSASSSERAPTSWSTSPCRPSSRSIEVGPWNYQTWRRELSLRRSGAGPRSSSCRGWPPSPPISPGWTP